jgi:hydroxymethylglutaryl-CoA lyase
MAGDFVRIFEMSPRDGLQNEARPVATADKIRLVDLLSACGFQKIEVTSFVSPKWVPQLADAAEVFAGIHRLPGIAYAALTPNLRGYEAALAAGADEVAIFAAASESFSRANINCSIAESLSRFAAVMEAARADDMPVRGYVSCAVHCPYEGAVAPGAVAEVTRALFALGCYEVSLGDTTGQGRPEGVAAMLDAVLGEAPPEKLAGHFHDTAGHAVENVRVGLGRGLRSFDASVAGLGGCPYAPGAKGNVDTRAVVGLLDRAGYTHGLDEEALAEAARFARSLVTSAVGASE